MRKLILGLTTAAVLATGAFAENSKIESVNLGTTGTFFTGEIAGNSNQVGINVKYTELLRGDDKGFWTGNLQFTFTKDYKNVEAPISYNFYNLKGILDVQGISIYPFITNIKNVETGNKQNFGGIGISTNYVLHLKNIEANIELGGKKSVFDKSTHKFANLFIKIDVPMQNNLSAYFQVGKVFITDKATTTTTTNNNNSVGDKPTTTTVTNPVSSTQNTFLMGVSYSF